jgi:hypothetical protein
MNVIRDLLKRTRCSHGKKVNHCPICMAKVDGQAFRKIFIILEDYDVTQAVMNIVFDELRER